MGTEHGCRRAPQTGNSDPAFRSPCQAHSTRQNPTSVLGRSLVKERAEERVMPDAAPAANGFAAPERQPHVAADMSQSDAVDDAITLDVQPVAHGRKINVINK
jgi:hypothetical protein